MTYGDLQTLTGQLAEGSLGDIVVDPDTGGSWIITTLLQEASGQSTWLDASASPSARELQLSQVYGLLTWRPAFRESNPAGGFGYGFYRTASGATPSGPCSANPSGGYSVSSALQTEWSNELTQALAASAQSTGTSSDVGVSASTSGGTSTVNVFRQVVKLDLPQSGSAAPLPNVYINDGRLFANKNAAPGTNYQQPPNAQFPISAVASGTTAGHTVTAADADLSGTSLGTDSQGPNATRRVWTVPPSAFVQDGTQSNPSFVESLLVRYAAQPEPPAGFPMTNVDGPCYGAIKNTVAFNHLIYREDLPPLTGSAATIAGIFRNGSGEPIANATINLAGPNGMAAQTVTNSLGHYEFGQLPSGGYEVYPVLPPPGQPGGGSLTLDACTANLCSPTIRGWSISVVATNPPGAPYTIDFRYKAPAGRISGTVRDRDGKPLAGVPIGYTRPDGTKGSTTTDANGAYAFEQLPGGDFDVHPSQAPAGQPAGGRWMCTTGPPPGPELVADSCVLELAQNESAVADFVYFLPDIRAEALEVTQGIQEPAWFTAASLTVPGVDGPVPGGHYTGVPLVERVRTVARLYAHVIPHDAFTGTVAVTARLRGYSDDAGTLTELPGGPIEPTGAPTSALSTNTTLADTRTHPGIPFTFDVPAAWVKAGRDLALVAEVNPVIGDARQVAECTSCDVNNRFALGAIAVKAVGPIKIAPARVTYRFPGRVTRQSGPDLGAGWNTVKSVLPIPADGLDVAPYPSAGTVDLSAVVGNLKVAYKLTDPTLRECVNPAPDRKPCRDIYHLAALYQLARLGQTGPGDFIIGYGVPPTGAAQAETGVAILGEDDPPRPLTAMAHELMHLVGFGHASAACGGNVSAFDDWPPDQQGYIQGIGLDRRTGSGGSDGPYRIIADGIDNPNWFDVMSYCNRGTDRLTWISVRNWRRFITIGATATAARAPSRALASVAANRTVLQFDAAALPDGKVFVLGVTRETGTPSRSAGNAPYTIVARNAAGTVVARVGVSPRAVSDSDGGLLEARLPGAGITSLSVISGGKVVTTVKAAKRPPRVRLLKPRSRARLRNARPLQVRWRASGARGRTLTAKIEYASDGRHFRTLAIGITEQSITLPARALEAAKSGALRVTVNDGFRDAVAAVRRLRVG